MGSPRRVKAPICMDPNSSAMPSVCDIIHKGDPDCHGKQSGILCSPINAPQDHEMHPRDLTALVKKPLVKADLAIYCVYSA